MNERDALQALLSRARDNELKQVCDYLALTWTNRLAAIADIKKYVLTAGGRSPLAPWKLRWSQYSDVVTWVGRAHGLVHSATPRDLERQVLPRLHESDAIHAHQSTATDQSETVQPKTAASDALTWWRQLFRSFSPQTTYASRVVYAVGILRNTIESRLMIGFVGAPSAGKDALIEATFGVEMPNISPVAGSTVHTEEHSLPGVENVYVLNTPGIGDVNESVSETAEQHLGFIDIFCVVINADGGLQKLELSIVESALQTGRPVVVFLNKMDLIRTEHRERYVDDARSRLPEGVPIVTGSARPLAALGLEPSGIDELRGELTVALNKQNKNGAFIFATLGLPIEMPPFASLRPQEAKQDLTLFDVRIPKHRSKERIARSYVRTWLVGFFIVAMGALVFIMSVFLLLLVVGFIIGFGLGSIS